MASTQKVHFQFRELTRPFYGLIALAILMAVELFLPARAGPLFYPVLGLIGLLVIVQWRQYYSLVAGAPAYVFDTEGVWVELTREKVAWERITRVQAYSQPEILLIEYPMRQSTLMQSLLPHSMLKQTQHWQLDNLRVKESIPQIFDFIERHHVVERHHEVGAP